VTPGDRIPYSVLPPAEMGAAHMEKSVMVYVVTLCDLYADHLMNVFSSKEAANAWIAKQDKEEGEYWLINAMVVIN